MYFNNPIYLLLLLLLIPIVCQFIKLYNKFKHKIRFDNYLPTSKARCIVFGIKFLAFVILILGLADLVWVRNINQPVYKNVRLFFLVDVSNSMIYANDIKPNRLEAVKTEVGKFILSLDGNYEIAIIPFSGVPNIYYCPLTTNHTAYNMIKMLSRNDCPALGTNIDLAIRETTPFLKDTGLNIMVLLTDGGREEADVIEKTELYKTIASYKNTKIYTVGVGGKSPALLTKNKAPLIEEGKIAYSQLYEEILKDIAIRGKGEYIYFSGSELTSFLKDVMISNRILDNYVQVSKKENISYYLFALSSLLFLIGALWNYKIL